MILLLLLIMLIEVKAFRLYFKFCTFVVLSGAISTLVLNLWLSASKTVLCFYRILFSQVLVFAVKEHNIGQRLTAVSCILSMLSFKICFFCEINLKLSQTNFFLNIQNTFLLQLTVQTVFFTVIGFSDCRD